MEALTCTGYSRAKLQQSGRVPSSVTRLKSSSSQVSPKQAAIVDLEKDVSKQRRFEKLNVYDSKAQIVELEAKLALLRKNDPRQLKGLEDSIEKVKEGAIRWTDNVYALHDYLKKKFSMPSKGAARTSHDRRL